jgi:hypothetical protein
VFVDYEPSLKQVFKYFSKKADAPYSLKEDITLDVQELINMLQKAKLLEFGNQANHVSTEDIIRILERYYTPGTRLEDKLTEEKFYAFLKANPLKLAVNREIEEWKLRMAQRQEKIEDIER